MSGKTKQLIEILQKKQDWISASELADQLNVSKRMIANYVKAVNAEEKIIFSSSRGYKIKPGYLDSFNKEESYITSRQMELALHLCFSKDGINIYDEADRLFVSDSTLNNDLDHIRREMRPFDVTLTRTGSHLSVSGTEADIRRFLIVGLYRNNLNLFFKANENKREFGSLQNDLKNIIQHNGIYINDYSLALFVLNVCICIQRRRKMFTVEDLEIIDNLPVPYQNAVSQLSLLLAKKYDVALNKSEETWLMKSLLSSSSLWDPKTITASNLSTFVEKKYIDITKDLLKQVKSNFPSFKFHDDFFVRFTIHIRNCFMQGSKSAYGMYNIDSLAVRIKYSYPQVYDVAVFIADYLDSKYGLQMTQNEITYIAFHICSSMTDFSDYKVTITFVYADYWDYHKKVLSQIIAATEEKGIIKQSVAISNYIPAVYHSDLIVTDSNALLPEPCVHISSVASANDIEKVKNAVSGIYQRKQYNFFKQNFLYFFSEKCFIKSNGNDYLKLLDLMCSKVKEMHYVTDEYYPDLLKREKLANTVFNTVAIPHTLTVYSIKSFIFVAICNPQIKWGKTENKVKIVVMLGINKHDRRTFSKIYDYLVEILSDNKNVAKLATAGTFDEFSKFLQQIASRTDII